MMKNDLRSSIDALRHSLSLSSENINARPHLSTALLAPGEIEEGKEELERNLLIESGNSEAQLDIAVLSLFRWI